MSRVIGVLNCKGGTGKTTTVVNLAAGLAMRGERVLCIDLDAQGNLATYLGVHHSCTLTQLLLGEAETRSCIVQARENLDLIPSGLDLLQAEGTLWQMKDHKTARNMLSERMQGINTYDYILLDHSPSASLLNESGLLYAHPVIVPVSMDYLALVGIRQVLQMLKSIRQNLGHDVQVALVVPTFYYAWLRKDREIMGILHNHFTKKLAEPIRAGVRLSEAPSHKKSIYEYAPRSAGSLDYARLVERVVENG